MARTENPLSSVSRSDSTDSTGSRAEQHAKLRHLTLLAGCRGPLPFRLLCTAVRVLAGYVLATNAPSTLTGRDEKACVSVLTCLLHT